MATKSATLRGILELIRDTGETPSCDLDESLVLSGWEGLTHREFKLSAAAVDTALGLVNDSSLVIIISHDNPFSVRLKAAEKLLEDVRFFAFMATDPTAAAYDVAGPSDILLTGNGTNETQLEIYTIDTET
jgi:hypothetical protein